MKFLERRMERECIFEGKILNLFRDKVCLPDGSSSYREVIEHLGAVCILPIDENENAYYVQQYRYAINCELLELPAGKLDPGETPEFAAKRELKEETGLTALKWIYLGEYYPSPGYSDEVITCFLAEGLINGNSEPDEGEFLSVNTIPYSELLDLVEKNKIKDGKTCYSVLMAEKFRKH